LDKSVVLGRRAFEWLLRHRFMSEDVIIGIVKYHPTRHYSDEQHFEIEFKRKKDHKLVLVKIFVEETSEKLFVYKIHSQRL